MTLIYKPFGILFGLVAGILARKVFTQVWARVDEQDPPAATTQDADWAKLLSATALQGVVYMVVRMLVNRAGANAWYHLTGVWPGERRPDPK